MPHPIVSFSLPWRPPPSNSSLCLQLRQWKTFEEENQTLSHMAKYFSSPSRSYHSVYSEEQLYQLIGEKNSMKQLLTEVRDLTASPPSGWWGGQPLITPPSPLLRG